MWTNVYQTEIKKGMVRNVNGEIFKL